MRKLILAAALSVGAVLAFSSPVFAQADPTMNQIYEAAAAGHLDQAQQMITQVLADHPNSAKAHYVQAELYAKQGKTSMARVELGIAERLNPGLTSFSPRSVQELKSQLGPARGGRRAGGFRYRTRAQFPWGALIGGVVALLMMVFRRAPMRSYPPGAGPGTGGARRIWPRIRFRPWRRHRLGDRGRLARVYVARVVAGEELAHHFWMAVGATAA